MTRLKLLFLFIFIFLISLLSGCSLFGPSQSAKVVKPVTVGIAGYVKDSETGEGIFGARVTIEDENIRISSQTDYRGAFMMPDEIPPGKYTLRVETIDDLRYKEYIEEELDIDACFSRFLEIPLKARSITTTVTGRVVDSAGKGVGGVTVVVGDTLSVETDSEGYFSRDIIIDNVLAAKMPSGIRQEQNMIMMRSDYLYGIEVDTGFGKFKTSDVRVQSAIDNYLLIQLPPFASIKGRIVDEETNKGLFGDNISINIGDELRETFKTDINGNFTISKIVSDPQTPKEVTIRFPGYKEYKRTVTLGREVNDLGDILLSPLEIKVMTIVPIGTTEPTDIAITRISTGRDKIYLVNSRENNISVIDTVTNKLRTTIESVGSRPLRIAITNDNSRAYFSVSGEDIIRVIDVATDTLLGIRIKVGDEPHGLVISEDDKWLYVANFLSNDISVVDLSTNKEVKRILTGAGPEDLVINANIIYVTNFSAETVSMIDRGSLKVIGTLNVGGNPYGILYYDRLYVTNYSNNNISSIALSDRIDIKILPSGAKPTIIKKSELKSQIYVINQGSSSVTVIYEGAVAVDRAIDVKGIPRAITLSRDGNRAYIAVVRDGGSMILVVDVSG